MTGVRIAAIALTTTLAMAGCGPKDDDEPRATAGDPAVPTGTTTAEPSPTETDGGQKISIRAFIDDLETGVSRTTTAHNVLTVTGPAAMTGEGDIDYRTDPTELQMTLDGAAFPGGADMRVVGGFVYMNLGELSGGKFQRLTLEEMNELTGSDFAASLEPMAQVTNLRQGVTSVTYTGAEEYDGGGTAYRYHLVIDTAMVGYLQAMPGLPDEMEMDVWVDSKKRILKTLSVVGGTTTTMIQSDFGKRVEIAAPPASQVTTL